MNTKTETAVRAAALTGSQQALQKIWADVLGSQPIDLDANFFDLGGDSMKVMDIIVRVRDEMGIELPLMVFFEDPTVTHIAAFIDGAAAQSPVPLENIVGGILAEALGVSRIERDANFFDVGGNSMMVMDVILRVRELLRVELPLLVFFEEPTAAHIAEFIRSCEPASFSTQTSVEKIWTDVLGAGDFGPDTNFFDAGGNSMSAMDLILRVREVFAIELPLMVFYEEPTVAQITAFIDEARSASTTGSIVRQSGRREFPLAYSQEPFWLLEQRSPGIYNTARIFNIRGTVQPSFLEASLNEICRRHDILRVRFAAAEDGPFQAVEACRELRFDLIDLTGFKVDEIEAETRHLTLATVRAPLALDAGEVLRARLIRRAAQDWLLCIAIHHAVSDGVSGGILLDELVSIYDAFALGLASPLPEPDLQFTDYASWQRAWMQGARLEEEITYWTDVLQDAPRDLKWPVAVGRGSGFERRGAVHVEYVAPQLQARLRTFAQANGTTLFTLLAAALRGLLYRWSGQSDFVMGTIASNRSRSGTERMIGCFVNPLPLRNPINAEQSLLDLLNQENSANREAFAHQDCPFTKIVEAVNPERASGDNPLFNVALLLQNFPVIQRKGAHFEAEHASINAELALLDLRFIVTDADDKMEISCQYSVGIFEENTIAELSRNYIAVLQQMVENPELAVAQITLSDMLRDRGEKSRRDTKRQTIAIAANFTAEPVEEPLNYWIEQLQFPGRVEFAPFDQVFQQLLDPASLLSQNRGGINLVMFQWRRNKPAGDEARELAAALKSASARRSAPILLFICPPSVEAEDEILALELAGESGIHITFAREILDLYPVDEILDEYAGVLGAIPYSEKFYVALASVIARKSYGLNSTPFKVIALDCDNTLWRGVCGEDGPLGIRVDSAHKALQEFMLAQRDAGMLLCLCSKNAKADVEAVFDTNPGMLLRREHLTAVRVNWSSKSENLRDLAGALGVGVDSFIFIDDNPLECAEVRANCPEALVLELPAEHEQIPRFLKHVWAFDRFASTKEDRSRSELYRQQQEREYSRRQAATLEEFLLGLELKVQIRPMNALDIPRVAQLTLRTNQFNCTTIRRTDEEIAAYWQSDGECLVVEVNDRFGDYGLVGVVLFKSTSEAITVDTFLLSCRALGRMVEHQMLAHLGNLALDRKLPRVDVGFVRTARNQPAFLFLQTVGGVYADGVSDTVMYRLPADHATRAGEFTADSAESEPSSTSPDLSAVSVRPDLLWIATRANTVQAVSDALRNRPAGSHHTPSLNGRARSVTEDVLAAIWASLLRVEEPGIHDDFFRLGGNSLLGVQMISRVRQSFGVDLPIRALFEDPTLSGLAQRTDRLLAAERGADAPPLVRCNHADIAVTSFAQQRLWFINQLDHAADAVYNIPQMISISGALKTEALERSLHEIVRRHEVLRTTFQNSEGQPMQLIGPVPDTKLPIVDLSCLEGEELLSEVQRLAFAEAAQPFDLRRCVMRLKLLRTATERHVLLVVLHHIAGDRWSAGVLAEELQALYAAYAKGEPSPFQELPIQYSDYAIWQRKWLTGEVLEKQLAYWKAQLEGAPALLDLPTDRPRPPVLRHKGATESCALPAALVRKLTALSNGEGATLFMTLLAGLQALLGFYSGQEDLVVGTPIAGRNRIEIEALIGFFVNTLALRGDLSGNPTFREFMGRVRRTALDAYANQDLPFEKLVEELQPERSLSYQPVFQVLFALQNAPQAALELAGLRLERLPLHQGTATFDMSWFATPVGDEILLRVEYDTDLFHAGTIRVMTSHLEQLLETVSGNPDTRLSDLMPIAEAERTRIFHQFNDTAAGYPRDVCIQDLVSQRSKECPGAVAIIDGVNQLSYAELEAGANQIARFLMRLGARPDVPVAVFLRRSAGLIRAILGILKAGSAYVPLDPAYPSDRLQYILDDCQAPILITESALEKEIPPFSGKVIVLDREAGAVQTELETAPQTGVTSTHLAYILFTSGSTGKPKGVAIEHRTPVTFIHWAREIFSERELSGVLFSTSVCFDVSMFEMFVTLAAGGAVIVAENALSLPELEARNSVTLINAVPSVMAELARVDGIPRSVLVLNLAGEAVPNILVDRLYQSTSARKIYNLYGPTETSYATFALLKAGSPVTIGRPLANTFCYVLDSQLRLTPVGVQGELYIAGDGVARGYYRQPEMTAQRFLPNPFANGTGRDARIYKTGDRCRWLANGELQYLGRSDFQVKLRGFRIELGEIESALDTHSGVEGSVALVREDEPGMRRLVAYVVPSGRQEITADELQRHLQSRLPEFMVPSDVLIVEEFPRTANGKIDRQKLPIPERKKLRAYVAPETVTERELAEIWSKVLQVEGIGADDNFFALGGHSLLAMQVISRIRLAMNIELPVRSLFEAPTIRELAARASQASRPGVLAPIPRISRDSTLPLSSAQERLWFLDQLEPANSQYNFPMSMQLTGPVDASALETALNGLIARHEVLRTTYRQDREAPVQFILPELKIRLVRQDVSHLPRTEREVGARRLVIAEGQRPFELATGPLLRAHLIRLDEQDHILLVNMHHSVTDAWSMRPLVRELSALYEAAVTARPCSLPELPIQYADYAVWQRDWLGNGALKDQLAYWKEHLAGAPSRIALPTDRPRPSVQSYSGATETFVYPKALLDDLQALARREDSTLYMVLTAAFGVLLRRYAGQESVVIGTMVANRSHAELEDLIGLFVNTLPIHARLGGNPSFRELLRQIRTSTLGAFTNSEVPFEEIVKAIAPERDLSANPIAQAFLILQDPRRPIVKAADLQFNGITIHNEKSKFDIGLFLVERPQGLECMAEFASDLFDRSTIRRMLEQLGALLRAVVENADTRVEQIALLSASERHKLLFAWNATDTDYPRRMRVHELFEAQAQRCPDSIAAVFGDRQVTYAELNGMANRIAHGLRAEGALPGTLVGVLMNRGIDMLAALLGTLKSGAAYVPLDPSFPKERIALILEDSNARIVLTDDNWRQFEAQAQHNVDAFTDPEDLAYVLHTSGSTGKPKGVQITHRNLVNFLSSMQREPGLTTADKLLAITTISFDIAGLELYLPLISGATVQIASREQATDGTLLVAAMREFRPTVLQATPATWRMLLDSGWEGDPTLTALCGGEALAPELAAQLLPRCRHLWNMYGPTETTIWSSVYKVASAPSGTVSLGRPIANTTMYVLDTSMAPVPTGVAGELYIGGDGVGRGYLNRPDLTAEKFLDDPFVPGRRVYRTGDLARFDADGNVLYLGRADLQIKVRGFRIELGEIEAVVAQHAAVRECVATVSERGIAAYFICETRQTIMAQELRQWVREKLPEYMTPSCFLQVDRFPLTPNGKVDRKALPAPDSFDDDLKKGSAHGLSLVQQLITDFWADVLKRDTIGLDDDFFELGGHSLSATQIVARTRAALGVDLPLRAFFEAPTPRALSQVVDELTRRKEGVSLPSIRPIARESGAPLSLAQQRLWFLQQVEPDSSLYNVPWAVRLRGPISPAALKAALNGVAQRHEVLRTVYRVEADADLPVQVVQAATDVPFRTEDLTDIPAEMREDEARRIVQSESSRPFRLASDVMLRALLVTLEERDHVLMVNTHHIACDAWSLGILASELALFYEAALKGREPQLSKLVVQYADYAIWQRDWLKDEALKHQIDYWTKRLADAPPFLSLPTDHERPATPRFRGAAERKITSDELHRRLVDASRQRGTTVFMTMLAAFQCLIYHLTKQTDIVLGTDLAGRTTVETEDLIGFFVNLVAVRADLSGDLTFSDLTKQVREITLGAHAHQDLPFDKVVEELQPERRTNRNPLVQVLFVHQNTPAASLNIPGVEVRGFPVEVPSKFDMAVFYSDHGASMNGVWVYNPDLFEPKTVARMVGLYESVLELVVADGNARISEIVNVLARKEEQARISDRARFEEDNRQKLKALKRKSL